MCVCVFKQLDREIVTKSFVSSKTFQLSTVDSGVFRQPVVPFRRPTFSLDPIKQMPNVSNFCQIIKGGYYNLHSLIGIPFKNVKASSSGTTYAFAT